ncbi:MAG: 2-dehydro-3-deoxy-D-gluconate 5-dehydrogenase KduD [Spirochaetota bacterium]
MLDQFRLTGKVAIVTGANAGLGQAMAMALADAGASVALVGRRAASETLGQIQSLGGRAYTIIADLANTQSLPKIMSETIEHFGQADILVNNAGIIRREDSIHFSEQDWDEVMATNLKTPMFLSQAFARHLLARKSSGKIINIASMLSFQGGIRVPSYTSSKSGLLGLTRLLACEWAQYGVNVNAIAPGYMETNNTLALRNDEERNRQIVGRIPAGRWGKPQDLAGAVVFLASAASDYVHGYTVAVDGGWLAR